MAVKFDPVLGKLRESDAGAPGADGVVQAIVAGSNITVDATDPTNPIVKLSTIASKTYKGRTTAGVGVVEDVAVATLKTDLALVKADVGLGNVDNTSDAAKPVSTATQTALDGKANSLGADDNYVTDAEKTKLSNLSGTNTGDNSPNSSSEPSGTVATHAALTTGVHGVGVGTVAKVSDIATDANLSANAQNAVSTRHAQNTDTDLDATFEASLKNTDNHTSGSTNKVYTATEQTKLAGIATGAEVNVNADWNSVSGDSQILNKPTISGSNTGDQTSIVGITGTIAQFNTAITDGDLATGGGTATGTNTGDNAVNSSSLSTAAFSGLTKITVGTSTPGSPSTGDLWVDTN